MSLELTYGRFSVVLGKFSPLIFLWIGLVSNGPPCFFSTIFWSISVMTNRGTAYILYYDPADAEAAIAHMHESQLDGATLNVSIVLPRRAFSRSPPPAHTSRGPGHQRYARGRPSGSRLSRPSPQRHRSPRRYGRARHTERHDLYRPRSPSRSWSPRRSRSLSSQSTSQSTARKSNIPGENSRRHKRRSPSYSSYDYSSHSDRSLSPRRSRSKNRS